LGINDRSPLIRRLINIPPITTRIRTIISSTRVKPLDFIGLFVYLIIIGPSRGPVKGPL
jgi:hypothetical protein